MHSAKLWLEIKRWLKGHFWSVAKAEPRIWCATWNSNLESYLLNSCRRSYWRGETIQGRQLFAEKWYLNKSLMANTICKINISILVGNLNSCFSYLITTVQNVNPTSCNAWLHFDFHSRLPYFCEQSFWSLTNDTSLHFSLARLKINILLEECSIFTTSNIQSNVKFQISFAKNRIF